MRIARFERTFSSVEFSGLVLNKPFREILQAAEINKRLTPTEYGTEAHSRAAVQRRRRGFV